MEGDFYLRELGIGAEGLETPKDCPFCGKEPVVSSIGDRFHDYRIACTNYKCAIQPAGRNFRVSLELAIRDWNTRINRKG